MGLNAFQCSSVQPLVLAGFFLMQIAQSLRSDIELHKSTFWTIFTKPTSAVQNGNVRLQDEIVKTTSFLILQGFVFSEESKHPP